MNFPTDQSFNTNNFFAGGAGIFSEFHDVIKPVYLYAIINMILSKQTYGLPISIIENFSLGSIIEWYKNRRYINPLKQLDWANKASDEELDEILSKILKDESIYKLAPSLNIDRLLYVYKKQHMVFPWFIYSKDYEPGIAKSCKYIFNGIQYKYLYGDLKEAISKCDQNFTYIFSDIETVAKSAEILKGTCSNIILAKDYRYNYKDNFKTFKYDLPNMQITHPFIRIELNTAMDLSLMAHSFDNIKL